MHEYSYKNVKFIAIELYHVIQLLWQQLDKQGYYYYLKKCESGNMILLLRKALKMSISDPDFYMACIRAWESV